jgi:hypothetical protein
MAAWRSLGILVTLLGLASEGRSKTAALSETIRVGDCQRIQLDMKLTGEMRLNQSGKIVPIKLEATAEHDYSERILSADSAGLPNKSARRYDKARAIIATNRDSSERTLRDQRRLVVAQRFKDQLLVYAPTGPLTREEQELTSEHFDSLPLTGILPGKEVAIGDSWKIGNAVAQALCGFEGLTEQNLVGRLEEIKDGTARFNISGAATGIDVGALVKLTIDGTARFDLNARRLIALEWKQQDDRAQGPVSPAAVTQTTITLSRAVIDLPSTLSDVALVAVPEGFEAPPGMSSLEWKDPKGRFAFVHAREWQTSSQTDEHLVLRLMERGDFVAQATITPWTSAEKGKHQSPEEFQAAMDATPGWQSEKVLQSGEVPSDGGRWIYRISALGQLDSVNVLQNFYLVAGPDGEQVVIMFTMTPKQAERLGTRDLALAASMEFPGK